MKKKIIKAYGYAKRVASEFREDCHFSLKLAIFRSIATVSSRLGISSLSNISYQAKHRWIAEFLAKELAPVLETYSSDHNQGQCLENAPIWICWWTGEESAPPLVKKCIASIRQNAGNHPVHLITQDNFFDYVTIPDRILSMLASGTMCIANFSDYLRFSLLAEYGGLWLDATIFCSEPLPDTIFQIPLFTCKGGNHSDVYISNYQWTSFCFGGYSGHVLFRYFKSAFERYWERNQQAVDYLLVDYLIHLGNTTIAQVRKDLDQIPANNLHRDDLAMAMCKGNPYTDFHKILQPDTYLYKLSWREHYEMKTPDGEDTVFGWFLKKEE